MPKNKVVEYGDLLARNVKLIDQHSPTQGQKNSEPEFTNMKSTRDRGKLFLAKDARMGELPSAGVQASARGLAKIAAYMA